jgi:hypothetical protein
MSIWDDVTTVYKTYSAPEWNLEGRWGQVIWGLQKHNRLAVKGQLNSSVGAKTEEDADKEWQEKIDFLTKHYADKVKRYNNPTTVVVDGVWYGIGEEVKGPKSFKGFGGAKWTIKFHDGREVVSTNLWYGGQIPPAMRDKLPDNAVFITEDK